MQGGALHGDGAWARVAETLVWDMETNALFAVGVSATGLCSARRLSIYSGCRFGGDKLFMPLPEPCGKGSAAKPLELSDSPKVTNHLISMLVFSCRVN